MDEWIYRLQDGTDMTQIDSLDITGMKKADFDQLYTMYLEARNDGIYYGRKDYWDKRIDRLDNWFRRIAGQIEDVKIKEQ